MSEDEYYASFEASLYMQVLKHLYIYASFEASLYIPLPWFYVSICWKIGSMLGFVKFMVLLLSWFNISICCESEVGMNNGVLIFISKLLTCEVLYARLGMGIVVSCAIRITTSWAVRLDACVRWFSLLLYLAWGLTPQDRYRLDGIVL